MRIPLQVTMQGLAPSEALEARIHECAAKLEQFHPRLTSCRVHVEEIGRHRHQGRRFEVRVEARAPGHEDVAATLKHHEDVYVAVRDAFDAMRRRLEDKVREARGDVKAHARALHGKVARLDAEEGFGFIATDDGRELYFSRENVVHPSFDRLEPGASVQFIEEIAAEGAQAKRVTAGKHGFGA